MELNPNRGAGNREAEPLLQIELYSSSQDSLQQRTAWAISQLATRRYQASCRRVRAERPDSGSSCSSAPMCAICLEEFSEGQVRWARLEMEVVAGGAGWTGLGMTPSYLHQGPMCCSSMWSFC